MSQARLQLDCRGVVQGVGFRPLVHRLATELQLEGEVENVAGAVRLLLQGERLQLEQLVRRLPLALHPPGALEPLEPRWLLPLNPAPRGLRIAAAAPQPLGPGLIAAALVPDLAPCLACLAELRDPANRRYRYPFISCCRCGPRYSIATAEPYTRAHTTLAGFGLCAACQREFDDPADRRFHAETIGCPDCGPRLRWLGGRGISAAPPLEQAAALLRAGGIVALQGVGGFQLLVDAQNQGAIARLRARKGRPHKPLALLVAELTWLEAAVSLSPHERQLLEGPEAPIVLLRRRCAAALPPNLAPGSGELGVMLPASPLHWLLAEAFGAPLVATSGNPSGEPLCISEAQARQRLADPAAPIADGLLTHDRAIARPLDDSLLRCIDGRPALLRRARGFAPLPLARPLPALRAPERSAVLALGGDLKTAPALALGQRVWVAPHLGDLADGRCHDHWQAGLEALLARHGTELQAICSDQHPGYRSAQWARLTCSAAPQLRHLSVQHHLAHGLSVLAEHGRPPPALVVACDGLGYGDGNVPLWGGEGLLITADGGYRRLISLRPFPLPGAERAMAEPRRSALGWLTAAGAEALNHPGAQALREAFTEQEWEGLRAALAAGVQSPLCSSLGRLLDAVASLLNLVQRNRYEGHGALVLQGAAEAALQRGAGLNGAVDGYRMPVVPAPSGAEVPCWWDWQPLLQDLLADCAIGIDADLCALRVHRTLINAITAWIGSGVAGSAEPMPKQPLPVVLCGGCFQNHLLLQGCIDALRHAGREPLWAEQLPCGDGGLALGQLLAERLQRSTAAEVLQGVPAVLQAHKPGQQPP